MTTNLLDDFGTILADARASNEKLQVQLVKNMERRKQFESIQTRMQYLMETLSGEDKELDLHLRTLQIIGSASDDTIDNALEQITSVINKSLSILFPTDRRVIHISKFMYRDQYLHYEVELEAGEGVKRDFTMSGTGLAQVVSFLFIVSFIDIIKARRLLVMDEILNGLHPDAKEIVKEIMQALAPRFQFLIVEYSMDIGKQFLVEKIGSASKVGEYQGIDGYFQDISSNNVRNILKNIESFTESEMH